MFNFTIDITSDTHIYIQIYNYIKTEIEHGRLTYQSKLPSSRTLAHHLQVSRSTIDMAYGQLIDEGYIYALPKKGYFIAQINNLIPALNRVSNDSKPLEIEPEDTLQYHFSPYGVDLDQFPYTTWKKLMRDILYDQPHIKLLESGNPQGDLEFREAISNYLHQSRGVRCDSSQLIIGAGIDYLLILLAQILGKEQHFALENPSYIKAYKILSQFYQDISLIQMNEDGIDLDELKHSEANIAYITPSHHFPLGTVMPIKKRLELLQWAYEKEDRYIIEDDYDSEFRYKGQPIPSLQGIDRQEKTIYMGTFSKAIAPAIRIGYMVLPKPLLNIYLEHFSFYANTVPRIEQQQLTSFLNLGYFQRHLNRMRKIYKAKRDLILETLEPYHSLLSISGENSGLHLLVTLKNGIDESTFIAKAKAKNLRLVGLSQYYIHQKNSAKQATIILGYASLTEQQLKLQLDIFIELLNTH